MPSSSSNFTGYSPILLDKVPTEQGAKLNGEHGHATSLIFHYGNSESIGYCIVCFLFHTKQVQIGFSVRKIAKQAVVHHTLMASWMMGCLK